MSKGKAFLVVGHKNWGKSSMLRALTDDSRYPRKWPIKSAEFFVRRMSNDDDPGALVKFAEALDPLVTPYLIATLCPTFNDSKAFPALKRTLSAFKAKYNVFFFALRHKCSNPDVMLKDEEIDKLERYGKVEIFQSEGAKSVAIAKAFRRFVEQYV
jgi:hypothetical protein